MDRVFMERAIELSMNGVGYVNPNPLVGAVIVKNGKIIGEGYHEFYGGPHAEVNAFKNAVEDVKGAAMYVTLEPCSHYGKTPPCADEIVRRGISRVVVGMKDPNPFVAGRGIDILKNAGIRVSVGVCEEKVKKINEIFIKYITTGRPFCILKTAMTLDGKIASVTGDSKWISSEESREFVHRLRHRTSGIMAGIGTVLKDDPMLNTRLNDIKPSDPTRIIVDSTARIPLTARVLNMESSAKTIIAATDRADRAKLDKISALGAEIIITPEKDNRVDLNFLMTELGKRGIDSILLEGGGELNFSALKNGVVDKIISFIAPKIIGGVLSKTPVGGAGIEKMKDALKVKDIDVCKFGEDILVEGYLDRGDS